MSQITILLVDLIKSKLSYDEIDEVFDHVRERSVGFPTGLELHLRGRFGKIEVIIMKHDMFPNQQFLSRSDFITQ